MGRQGTLAWELRAATSLARLLRNRGRPADAIACLQPSTIDHGGFGTVDLMRRNAAGRNWAMPATTEPSATAGDKTPISLRSVRLLAAQRLLLEGDRPYGRQPGFYILTVGSNAAASCRQGRTDSPSLARKTFVRRREPEDQVSALRRVLGDGQGGNRYGHHRSGTGLQFRRPGSL